MSPQPQKYALQENETWQFRKAQTIPTLLGDLIQRVCRSEKAVKACYVLDARRNDNDEIKIVIALAIEDDARQMDRIVSRLQTELDAIPDAYRTVAIMPARRFEQHFSGAKFYSRPSNLGNWWLRKILGSGSSQP